MRKIIAIGECVLDIVFDGCRPVSAAPGGLILNVASALGRMGHKVSFVGEAARDRVGDMIVDALKEANVDVGSVDRYTDGVTPASLIFGTSGPIVRYSRNNNDSFDVMWPRIDSDDILLFGGFYAIDPRVRPRMFEIVRHAAERKALIIYVPGFAPEKEPRIMRVMPAILENFEIADLVITRTRDLVTIFGNGDDEAAYGSHVGFYVRDFVNIDRDNGRIRYFHGNEVSESAPVDIPPSGGPMLSAAAMAGFIDGIMRRGVIRDALTGNISDVMVKASAIARETGRPVAEVVEELSAACSPQVTRDLMDTLLADAVAALCR